MTEEENKKAFDDCMDFIKNMKPPEFMEWWVVQNTGWSNGQSWFSSGGTDTNPYRAKSEEEAIQYITECRKSWDDPAVKWRIVHVTLERKENRSITTETWKEI